MTSRAHDVVAPPIVGAALWRSVMDQASQGQEAPRCQCTGSCGQPHLKAGGRCPRKHGGHLTSVGVIRLLAAPVDLAIEGTAAAALPISKLQAWCPPCFDGARRAARKSADKAVEAVLATTEGLF